MIVLCSRWYRMDTSGGQMWDGEEMEELRLFNQLLYKSLKHLPTR